MYRKFLTQIGLNLIILGIVTNAYAQWAPGGLSGPTHRLGNVGIGISTPTRPLHLRGSNTVLQIDRDTKDPGFGVTRWSPGFGQVWKSFFFYTEGNSPNDGRFIIADWGQNVSGPSTPRLVIDNVGNIGIGTLTPVEKLEVKGRILSGNTLIGICPIAPDFALFGNGDLDQNNGANYALKQGGPNFEGRTVLNSPSDVFFATSNSTKMILRNNGFVGIGTTSPSTILDVNGTTTTKVLTITGGSDIAEPFEITSTEEETIEAGAVVIIDKAHPGKLKLSQVAYDRKVIGVVSGANGVNPGMVLSQQDVLGGGENVAISGRVYVKANASNGTIEPGDFLTTSDIAGEAMKVTDLEQARGAILGKAMTTINEKGYVLVFISMQ